MGQTTDLDVLTGLTSAEVAERVAQGQVNTIQSAPTRTVRQIVRGQRVHPGEPDRRRSSPRSVIVAGSPKNALFGGRHRRQQRDRHRPGAAGQEVARRAARRQRPEGPRAARRLRSAS